MLTSEQLETTDIPYNQKFSQASNFRYFRVRFENPKICLREKFNFKRKFRSWYRYDILLHTLSNLKPYVNQGTIWCNYYTNNLYKPASLIDIVWHIPSDCDYMYLASLIGD